MSNFFFSLIVVLYEIEIEESSTINSIRSLYKKNPETTKLIIWDNSIERKTEDNLCKLREEIDFLEYIHTPENTSLAKIYNHCIEKSSDSEFIIIFDHDSSFSDQFFYTLNEAIKQNPAINLFVPIVKHELQIVSPGDFNLVRGKYWKTEIRGLVKAKNRVAIASGMTIRISYLNSSGIRFNENLKLYGIDSDFMLKYAKANEFFFILDYDLVHSLSVFIIEPTEKVLKRFKDQRRSVYIISQSRGLLLKLISIFYITYISIKMAIKYKDLRFLKL